MTELHLHGKVRKVGNSLAFLIPSDRAKEARLQEGSEIDVDIRPSEGGLAGLLGLLKDAPYEPFSRTDLYDDD